MLSETYIQGRPYAFPGVLPRIVVAQPEFRVLKEVPAFGCQLVALYESQRRRTEPTKDNYIAGRKKGLLYQ